MSLESSSHDLPSAKRPREEEVGSSAPPIQSIPTNITMTALNVPKRMTFHDDVEEMLFGFGDAWPPNPDVVEMMDRVGKYSRTYRIFENA